MYQPHFNNAPYNDNAPYMNYYEQPFIPNMYGGYRRPRSLNYYRALENTQKTLRTVTQIIPIVTHVIPVVRNAATMFRVARAVQQFQDEPVTHQKAEPKMIEKTHTSTPTNPTFF